jgi:hypothetical protein
MRGTIEGALRERALILEHQRAHVDALVELVRAVDRQRARRLIARLGGRKLDIDALRAWIDADFLPRLHAIIDKDAAFGARWAFHPVGPDPLPALAHAALRDLCARVAVEVAPLYPHGDGEWSREQFEERCRRALE